MIARDNYLNKLKKHMWNGDIKVITGIRRAGKSVLLFDIFYDFLLGEGVAKDHIIRLELDQRRNFIYRDPVTLCDYVESLVKDTNQEFYLFIDEVQFASPGIDQAHGGANVTIYDMLNELKSYKNLDVYVTGSNSRMLSKDIATEFRGRATQIHVSPLSFSEYFNHVGGHRRDALDQYMLYGGMPRVATFDTAEDKKAYLTDLCNLIYVKDLVERDNLEREDILCAILDYLASQVGSLTNPTNVANALTSMRHERISNKLVSTYMSHIADAFLIEEAKRYDIKGKTYFNYPNKYYYCDIGLRNARLNYRQFDPGHIMENIIYNELTSRGYSVDVGVIVDRTAGGRTNREVDFVVNNGDHRTYIQSAYQMDTVAKENSELQSLKLTNDFFKKIVVRMDIPHNYQDENGFLHCNLMDFLLGDVDIT